MAVERNQQVYEKVREQLNKYENISSKQLYDMATRMDPHLHLIGLRSFHARYVLPLSRAKAKAEGRLKPRKSRKQKEAEAASAAAPASNAPAVAADEKPSRAARKAAAEADAMRDRAAERARVRDVLLRFARTIAAADTRAELVDALTGVEAVVDEIVADDQPSS